MLGNVIQVALGGAIGASMRYGLGLWLSRLAVAGVPMPVLLANVVGSFVMGILAAVAMQRGLPGQLFLMTGVLGGFTTFSAFSLEVVTLVERGELGAAIGYMAFSVGLSALALALGLWMMRGVIS